jgi:AraC family transcriptional regulator
MTRGEFFGRIEGRAHARCARLTETSYGPGAVIPAHAHEEPYACLVLVGEFDELYRGTFRHCVPSSFLFYPPAEPHSESFCASGGRLLNIEIMSEWMANIAGALRPEDLSAHFQDGPVAASAVKLLMELRRPDTASPLIVEGLLLQVLGEAFRLRFPPLRRPAPRWLRAVREVLHARFSENLTLADLAKEGGVHPAYLSSAFSRYYGSSIGRYVRRLRIDFTCRRLLNPESALGDIALEAGFSDQSHFSREFKRQTGMTPTQYRSAANSS